MIKIYGTTLSNYYSTAKAALVEKGLAFEEVSIMPSQEPEVLAKSPMGKVPYIEIDGTPLTETNVIFDYLEDIQPQPALYPSDPWARAQSQRDHPLCRAVSRRTGPAPSADRVLRRAG